MGTNWPRPLMSYIWIIYSKPKSGKHSIARIENTNFHKIGDKECSVSQIIIIQCYQKSHKFRVSRLGTDLCKILDTNWTVFSIAKGTPDLPACETSPQRMTSLPLPGKRKQKEFVVDFDCLLDSCNSSAGLKELQEFLIHFPPFARHDQVQTAKQPVIQSLHPQPGIKMKLFFMSYRGLRINARHQTCTGEQASHHSQPTRQESSASIDYWSKISNKSCNADANR